MNKEETISNKNLKAVLFDRKLHSIQLQTILLKNTIESKFFCLLFSHHHHLTSLAEKYYLHFFDFINQCDTHTYLPDKLEFCYPTQIQRVPANIRFGLTRFVT